MIKIIKTRRYPTTCFLANFMFNKKFCIHQIMKVNWIKTINVRCIVLFIFQFFISSRINPITENSFAFSKNFYKNILPVSSFIFLFLNTSWIVPVNSFLSFAVPISFQNLWIAVSSAFKWIAVFLCKLKKKCTPADEIWVESKGVNFFQPKVRTTSYPYWFKMHF